MRLFISYSRDDVAVVGELESDLEAAGHRVFRDEEMSGGQHWWERLLREIRECDLFLFALSRASIASKPCQLEYRYASALGKTMLPVRVERGVSVQELPPELSTLQLVEYARQEKTAALALLRAITELPPSGPLPDVLPEEPEVPISYVTELRDQLADPEALTPAAQTALLDELDRRLKADDDPIAIENLLRRLLRRSDTTPGASRRAKRMLGAIEAAKPRLERRPPRWGAYLAAGGVAVALLITGVVLLRPDDTLQPPETTQPGPVDTRPVSTSASVTTTASVDPVSTQPTETVMPDPVTSASGFFAPDESVVDDVAMDLLDQYDDQATFLSDLGCSQQVGDRATYLLNTWDPAYMGSWYDGVNQWMWDPEWGAWVRWDGLAFTPVNATYWSFCTGRTWDPFNAVWVG